jgi:hypothetical protein
VGRDGTPDGQREAAKHPEREDGGDATAPAALAGLLVVEILKHRIAAAITVVGAAARVNARSGPV